VSIHTPTLDYISNQPVLKEWAEAKSLVSHAASLEPRDWRLPLLACQAVGGREEQAIPACAALACAQVGIILIDDMLDDDPRGEFHRLGMAQTANCAAALISAASQAILHSPVRSSIKLAAVQNLNQMITNLAFGQSLDIQNPADEAAYWRVVRTKSSPFFGTAFGLGAIFGGASVGLVHEIGKLGSLYGEMIQIHDDLNDSMTEPAGPDWLTGRSPLPILYAQTVDHPERDRFFELRRNISDPQALPEAKAILIHCGAVSYCIDQLIRRYQSAHAILAGMKLALPDRLNNLLEEMIAPVRKVLDIEDEQWEKLPMHNF
jgi:geranylgeranyl pyrophosphate synthase